MRYFKLGSLLAMVALSLSLAQPAQAYLFGNGNTDSNNILTLTYQNEITPGNSTVGLLWRDSGWYSGAFHLSSTTNYLVAHPGESGIENLNLDPDIPNEAFRNYFVFEIPVSVLGLSNPSNPIISASLEIYSYDVTSIETYKLFDVTTPIHTLIDEKDEFGNQVSKDVLRSAFDDLGGVTVYGSRLYSPEDSDEFREIALNKDFLNDLQLAINAANAANAEKVDDEDKPARVAIGGAVDTYRTVPPNVPEPSTLLLLGLALVGLAAWRRKHAA